MKYLPILLIAVLSLAAAAPAPWYWWSSKTDNQRVCAQTMSDRGWTRADGPYRDARCTKPLLGK